VQNLNFNVHTQAHLLRAAQEGIVFALNYGLDIMRDMGVTIRKVRAGSANMFLSPIFASAFASVTGSVVELYNTDGSQGAARGAGLGCGSYKTAKAAFSGLKKVRTIEPDAKQAKAYKAAYQAWLSALQQALK
jgi:xylulokinase